MFQLAYGEPCLSPTQWHELYRRLKFGRNSVVGDPKSGRHSTSTDGDPVEIMLAMIRQNCHLTVREFA